MLKVRSGLGQGISRCPAVEWSVVRAVVMVAVVVRVVANGVVGRNAVVVVVGDPVDGTVLLFQSSSSSFLVRAIRGFPQGVFRASTVLP